MYSKDRWEFYLDKKGEFRWRRIAPNGNIVGASTEGYKLEEDCVANAIRNGMKEVTQEKTKRSTLPKPKLSDLK
jgi:uncharacterized protein YegP (UPF0339 family)